MLTSILGKSQWFYLFIIFLFSMFGMKALFHPGLFTAHDIWHQVARLYQYHAAIKDGQFPPYWIANLANGYGYPLFFFSYHLPWLLGNVLLNLNIDIPTTLKALFFISFFASGLSMYFFVKNLLKDSLSALISSILYLWAPYHFLTIFVSASMGIAFVYIFIPLTALGIQMISEDKKIGIPLTAISLVGIILSHLMHLVFLSPLIFIFIFWELIRLKSQPLRIAFIKNLIFGFTFGILISSFYLIPSVYYNNLTRARSDYGFVNLYKRNFINFGQLVYSKWGYSPIVNNAKAGEISFQLGIAQWISIVSLTALLVFKKIQKKLIVLSVFLLTGCLLYIFLMLDFSRPIWDFINKIITLDYPFRLIMPLLFISSICTGIVINKFQGKLQITLSIILILIALYTNRNHINVNLYTNIPIKTYIDSEITTNSFNEYLPEKANPKVLELSSNQHKDQNTKSTSILINIDRSETFSFGQFYFPGQSLYIDNKKTDIKLDEDGLISSTLSKGQHKISVIFEDTNVIKLGKFLTLLSILLLVFFTKKFAFNQT